MINGCSTGCLPIHVSIIKVDTRVQKIIWDSGRKVEACFHDVWHIGIISQINMAAIKAITPPNFLGIERSIAYANRKYHSGWM